MPHIQSILNWHKNKSSYFLLDKLDIRDIMNVTKLDIRENKLADHARYVNPL